MKELFWGIVFIIVVGVGGFFYQNAVEHPTRTIACPVDAMVCPDGTSVARTGSACSFPACPLPNISLSDINISFALPNGFVEVETTDAAMLVAYAIPSDASIASATISIRRYPVTASSTALATIQQTAIGGASGLPISVTSLISATIGSHRFTVAPLERFEGVIDTAYYLARGTDVLRFDAVDRGADWTNPSLDVSKLPAHAALLKLLATLQGQG